MIRRRVSNALLHLLVTVLLCGALAVLIVGVYSAPRFQASAQNIGGNLVDVRVNQVTTADQQEPSLAVDPTNPNNILAAAKDWRTGPKQVWHYRSTDGGGTWTDGYANLLPSELPNQSDPVVAFDSAGTAYLAVLGYNQSDFSVGGVFVSRSHDVGATWQGVVELSSNTKETFNDKEWLTVDRSGNTATRSNVYVTWTLFTQTSPTRERSEIVISRSTDGGKTFSPRETISPPEHDSVQGSYPVVGPNGQVYVLYFNSPGQAQEEQEEEGGTVSEEVMQASGKNDALYMVTSSDGGQTFGPAVQVASVDRPPEHFAESEFRVFVLPALAVDPNNGTLYATWNDYGAGNSDVMLVVSGDGGKTWSSPRRLNDDSALNRAEQYFPTITVGKDTILHILWLDSRDDPSHSHFRPYYTSSTDGGNTFLANTPLSSSLSDPNVGFEGSLIGDYIALDVSGDGSRVYAAWVDTRNGDQDIYFSRFDTASPPPAEPLNTAARGTPVAVPSPQPLTGFNNRAFITRWERPDRAVVTAKAQRPWVWGPASFAAANEAYKQGANGLREVLYFDKARMEVNSPHADPTSPGYVTNGLLVVELISGRVQVGDAEFEPVRSPSTAPVAGDSDSPDALTYASLVPVASLNGDNRAPERIGQGVTSVLNRAGEVTEDSSKANSIKIARYEPALGHNIPDVFWTFMNATGPVYNGRFGTYSNGPVLDWVSDLGYPITEPYWTNVKIGGIQKSVLVQAYQRRVLTYVADNPKGWQVEMGNVGRHYFEWRYGAAAR